MTAQGSVLIADDDADVAKAARLALAAHIERIEITSSLEGLTSAASETSFDAVLLDMNFALGEHTGRDGMTGLARVQALDPTLSLVLMTAYGSVTLAVEALKHGASDFILKPWRNEKMVAAVLAAIERTRRLREAQDLKLEAIERSTIEKALTRHEGNIAQAAASLGLSRPALYRRMSKYGL